MGYLKGGINKIHQFWNRHKRKVKFVAIFVIALMAVTLAGGKYYQHLDDDPDRGAKAITAGEFDESFPVPGYLDQGWDESDSLWFYTTTQGSNLLPYDFFLVLEQANSDALFRSDANIDHYRYLVQKPTFFNPDGFPVGFALDEYQGKDYVGYTCAACHTGQVNYKGQAIRIDGGPAMADMDGFMFGLANALEATIKDSTKRARFVKNVIDLDNNYDKESEVIEDLELWFKIRRQYNVINHTDTSYGYARLDAFGRIYNRVLQYIINKKQLKNQLLTARAESGERILTGGQVGLVLEGIDDGIIARDAFLKIVDRLISTETGYPGLSEQDIADLSKQLFNEANAPVSYPFLWDITHSDYVQWNGLAANAGPGALGRNVGEVLGVFASIDFYEKNPWYKRFDIPAIASGQQHKESIIKFKSSVDKVNLQRLETSLRTLTSPAWSEAKLEKINSALLDDGQKLYAEYCQSCHEIINPRDWNRVVIAQMSSLDSVKTDPAMASNSVSYTGSAGNFKHTYQGQELGNYLLPEEAPVAAILTSAVKGVVATPDADKNPIRRGLDWLYVLAMSFFDNDIKASMKNGDYEPDTTANPYQSLLAYKARSLNGIWATAPFLHNGSVPTLYDLLLPKKREGDPDDGEYRPDTFTVGARELDPVRVGFVSEGYDGFVFDTAVPGNSNAGHEYAAGITPRADGKTLPPMTREERFALIEYMKVLQGVECADPESADEALKPFCVNAD